MKANQLDLETLKTELQEYAGSLKLTVKTDTTLSTPTSIRETDNRIEIRINPDRIHTKGQWEKWVRPYLIKRIGGYNVEP